MILALNYRELTSLIDTTNRLGNELNQYCDHLSSNVQNSLYQVEGGMSSSLNSADYYVKSKIRKLREKETNVQTLTSKTENLLDTAMTVDIQVARVIESNQSAFFKKNLDLKPSSFTVAMYSFWTGLTNIPVFGEGVEEFADAWSILSKEIRYWWECNGGERYFNGDIDTIHKMTLATMLLISGGSAGTLLANLLQMQNTRSDIWSESRDSDEISNIPTPTSVESIKRVVLDPSKMTPGTLKRINYLVEKINTLEDGEVVWEQMDHIGLEYTREDYENELERLLNLLDDPVYSKIEEYSSRFVEGAEGGIQAFGGGTEAATGWAVATGGSWTGIAIPVGGYLMVDGGSNVIEGGTKVINAIWNPDGESINPLRDYVFEKNLGEEKGEQVYNIASVGAGLFCMGKSLVDLKNANAIRSIQRMKNIETAQRLNLATEMKILDSGDNVIITIQAIDHTTDTPMILERILIDSNKIGKDVVYIGVDSMNTSKSLESSIEGVD